MLIGFFTILEARNQWEVDTVQSRIDTKGGCCLSNRPMSCSLDANAISQRFGKFFLRKTMYTSLPFESAGESRSSISNLAQ